MAILSCFGFLNVRETFVKGIGDVDVQAWRGKFDTLKDVVVLFSLSMEVLT